MGALGDIANLAGQAYNAWTQWQTATKSNPRELFSRYATPTYDTLKEVHRDYTDLYLELHERLHLNDELDRPTLQWFAKARRAKKLDRSELQLADFPTLGGSNDRVNKVNNAAVSYFGAIRDYFLPRRTKSIFPGLDRIKNLYPTGTGSNQTEIFLNIWFAWNGLSDHDRHLILAEEHLSRTESPVDMTTMPIAIENLLQWPLLLPGSGASPELANMEREETALLTSKLGAAPATSEQAPRSEWERLNWKIIISAHILGEMKRLEDAIANVQACYIQLRIACDRF